MHSAFGHAGQKCSAASLVILVGSVATSRRFRTQLVDAVTLAARRHCRPTRPRRSDPSSSPPSGKLLEGLTTLGEGESWLVEPRALDDDAARLWTPGVRDGVRRGSEYHLTEYFGPILGIMTAETLDEAIAIQNDVDYGLTAGLHSLDADEVAHVARLASRRATSTSTAASPARSCSASRSAAGRSRPSARASRPAAPTTSRASVAGPTPSRFGMPGPGFCAFPSPADALVAAALRLLQPSAQAWLADAVASDSAAWSEEFGALRDRSGLAYERNVFRYLPAEAQIRAEAGTPLVEIVRVAAAACAPGGRCASRSPRRSRRRSPRRSARAAIAVAHEDAAARHARLAELPRPRVRLLGAAAAVLDAAADGRPDIAVFDGPATRAGRIELLPFLHEQAVSITAHRFGNPDGFAAAVLDLLAAPAGGRAPQ